MIPQASLGRICCWKVMIYKKWRALSHANCFSWLRTLHRHHWGRVFGSRSGLSVFAKNIVVPAVTVIITGKGRSSNLIFHLPEVYLPLYSSLRFDYEPTKCLPRTWLDSSVNRAQHRYRSGASFLEFILVTALVAFITKGILYELIFYLKWNEILYYM